jgi:hypothetical protein
LIALLAGWSGLAQAEVKFADLSPASKANVKHGTLVRLDLEGGTNVTGHVVRVDPKENNLFLRANPGEAPVAYAGKDIKKIEPATRPPSTAVGTGTKAGTWRDLPNGLQEDGRGVLRIKPQMAGTAKPKGQKPAVIVEPEIHKQVAYNGSEASVVYTSSVLSPAERDALAKLQKAQNDNLALAAYQDRRERALALEMGLQEERLRAQRLNNDTVYNENMVNYPYPPSTPNAAGFGTVVNYYPFVPSYVGFPNYAGLAGYAGGRWPTNYKGVTISLPQVIPPAVGVIDRFPPLDPQALPKAREELSRVQSTAVYEDGRLIAVIVN